MALAPLEHKCLLTARLSLHGPSFGEMKIIEQPFPSIHLVRGQAWPAVCEGKEEVEAIERGYYDNGSRDPSGQQALALETFLGSLETSSALLRDLADTLILLGVDSCNDVIVKDRVDIENEFHQSTGNET